MDFSVPEELTALRASFATFLEREVRPLEEEVAPLYWRGETGTPAQREAAARVRRRSCQEGFYAAYLPERRHDTAGGRRCASR